tara:strand:- start:27 stop:203 length:177 start_codon:yes stop_codon:yes gene_type:complete
MKVFRKEATVKGYGNKKHTFEIERTEMAGHVFVCLKKNGNPIVKCTPQEFAKFSKLFQ